MKLEVLNLISEIILILLLLLNLLSKQSKRECGRTEEGLYDPYIEVNICVGEGTDAFLHLLRKEDVIEVQARAIPGCTIVTEGGDWYNSPDDYNEVVKLLRS